MTDYHMRFHLKGPDGTLKSGYSGPKLAVCAAKAATLARDHPDQPFVVETRDGNLQISYLPGHLIVDSYDMVAVPPWIDEFRTQAERGLTEVPRGRRR